MENHEPDYTVEENQTFDIITRKIIQLPEAETDLLECGSTYIGLNALLFGLIANSLSVHLKCDTDSYSCRLTNGISNSTFDSKHI